MIAKNVVWFDEVGKDNISLVGGKGANLGEMTRIKLPIPFGFIVTAKAYFSFIKANKLDLKISQLLNDINYENSKQLKQVSQYLQELILKAPLANSLYNEIVAYYSDLTLT